MKLLKAALAASLIALVALAPASANTQAKPEMAGLKHVEQFKFEGGTELATSGRYLYASEADMDAQGHRGAVADEGGFHIIDTKTMKEVGFLHCPGNDNDVEVVRPGLVVLSFHTNKCAPAAGEGLMLIDVKNPKKPRIISALNTGKNHTVKPFPGEDLLYTSGGGLGPGGAQGPAIVDVSNPAKPKVVAEPQTITMDCHDISFSIVDEDRQLGFCAGAVGTGEVQIWDVSDPLNPVTIARIVNPVIQYSHYAIANHDGTMLAIDDEAFAAHECYTGQSPTGRVWFYDISNPNAPLPIGSMAAPRGGGEPHEVGTYPGWVPSWCLSHGLDWHPKANEVAVTWFTGGVSVVNMDGATPTETAYFQADDSATYSALWSNGYLFTNDPTRGVDTFKVKGIK